MKFNEKLIMLRKERGLSQEALGEKLDVARQTVSKWELGETSPEMDKLLKISDIFEISLDELVKEKEDIVHSNNPNNANTQKLAGILIVILKGIGAFIIFCIVMALLGFILFNIQGKTESNNSNISISDEILEK